MADQEIFDIIVVGGGGSGLAAGAEAGARGAKVLLIEKGEQLGGTTAWSIGSFTASQTPYQIRAGVKDSPAQHFADMDAVNAPLNKPDNLVLRKILTEGAPETFRWLMDLGVEFIGPNPEPPHTQPRMHNVIPGASSYIYHVGKRCREVGVDIRCAVEFVDLVFENDRVVGIVARGPDGARKTYRAKQGVIIAGGDFSASKELRARYFPQEVVNAEPVNKSVTGEIFQIGEKYGARIVNGDVEGAYIPKLRFVPPAKKNWLLRLPPNKIIARLMTWGWRYVPAALARPFLMRFVTTALGPELNLFRSGAALVNSRGQMIPINIKSIAKDVALDPTNSAFILFDNKIARQFEAWPNFISTAPNIAYAYLSDYRSARKDVFHQADTVAGLAATIGVEAGVLEKSLRDHNATVSADKQQVAGPFYALGPVRGYITTTNGGFAVNERLEVLGASGAAIKGLYAAGSTGQGGILLGGHGHHIGWAFVSGRHAAKMALGLAYPA